MSRDGAGEGVPKAEIRVAAAVSVLVTVLIAAAVYACRRNCKKKNGKGDGHDSLQPSADIPIDPYINSHHSDSCHANAEEGVVEDAVENGSDDDDDELVESKFARAQLFFPDFDLSPRAVRASYSGKYGGLKGYIISSIQLTLDEMDQKTRERLMKRENAEEFCLELGMNKEIVRIKFDATRKFEEIMGLKFKTPILDSIYHLIEDLDYDNPFGEVNDCIQERYEEQDWLSYMGVSVNPKNLQEKINFMEQFVNEKLLGDCFMHGTTATTLQKVVEDGIKPSVLTHDFGPGVYCFKGQLRWALTYAFDRSWPNPGKKNHNNQGKKNIDISKITADNPSVIVFSNGKAPKDKTFHVGYNDHPYSDGDFRRRIPNRSYKRFLDKQGKWNKNNLNEFKWKHFVKLARVHGTGCVPENWKIFRGWLHNSDYLAGTDNCNEPVIDSDRWEQYCFTIPNMDLGEAMLYIELFVNWAEWVGREASPDQLEELKVETLPQIAKPTEGGPYD